jgi:hypothetical protein
MADEHSNGQDTPRGPKLQPPNSTLAREPKPCRSCTFRVYCQTHEHTCHKLKSPRSTMQICARAHRKRYLAAEKALYSDKTTP